MTFASAPWAVDGARTPAALARTASYAETGGAEGVISQNDLKVSPLDVPGVGLQIAGGGALVLNRYQTPVSQSYTVLNVNTHVVDAADMPPVAGSDRWFLVCVVVGDPEFSPAGHPFMTSDPMADPENFDYVRVVLVPCNSGTKSFRELNKAYPALALARVKIPANTTTVTAANIEADLRKVARPRTSEDIFTSSQAGNNLLNGGGVVGAYEVWPNTASFSVDIPEWATVCKPFAFIEGAMLSKAGVGALRITLVGAGATTTTNLNESAPTSGYDRKGYSIGGKITIPASMQGTTATIRIEGSVNSEAAKGMLDTDQYTGSYMRVRFEESAV